MALVFVALEVLVVILVNNSIHNDNEEEVDTNNDMTVEHEVEFLEVHLHEVKLFEVGALVVAFLDVED